MLDDSELQTLNSAFAKNNLGESLDRASRTNPDSIAESQEFPFSNDVYERNKPEIVRKKQLTDIDALSLEKSHPKTAKWLTDTNNSAVAIDDIDILKGMESAIRDNEKGFLGLRYDDLKRGFANLKRAGSYIGAETHMDSVTVMSLIDEHGITDRLELSNILKDQGMIGGVSTPVEKYLIATDEERKALKDNQSRLLFDSIGAVSRYTKEAAEIPRSVAGEKFARAGSFAEAWSVFTQDPIEVATGVTTESLAQFAPAIPMLFAGVPAAVVGAGGVSFVNEYVGDVVGSMQEAGIDVGTESQLLEALKDPEKMSEWRTHAAKRGIPIAVIDALSAGIGGRLIEAVKTPVKKVIAGATEALVVQPALGGAGEVAGALVAGDEISGKDVLAEMLGEIAPGVVETAAGTFNQAVAAKEAKVAKQVMETSGDQKLIDDIVTYAQSSKTNERAVAQYESFVNSLDDKKEVLIPNDVAIQLENAPDYITNQVNELGTSISIPLDKFASEIAINDEWMNIIRPHIKLSENTMSQSELDEGQQSEIKSLLEKAQNEQETLTEADRIYETVKDQIVATGMQAETTARHSAQLYPAAATVYVEKARKAGYDVSLEEVFEMFGFRVEKGVADAAKDVIFDQKLIPDDLEITMESEIIETGEVVEESFNAKELNAEIDNNLDSYKKLRDCL